MTMFICSLREMLSVYRIKHMKLIPINSKARETTSYLLAWILLAYWLIIITYQAHINAFFCMTVF